MSKLPRPHWYSLRYAPRHVAYIWLGPSFGSTSAGSSRLWIWEVLVSHAAAVSHGV